MAQPWNLVNVWCEFGWIVGHGKISNILTTWVYSFTKYHDLSRWITHWILLVWNCLVSRRNHCMSYIYIYIHIYMCVYIKAAGVYWANVKAPQTWMVLGVFGFQHVETFLKRDSVNRTQIHQTWATTHNSYPDGNSSKALTSSFILQASDRFCFSYFIYFDTRTPYPPLPVGCFLLARSPTIPACLRRIVDSNMVLGNFSQRLGESLRGFFRRRSLEVGHDNWASNLTENGW